MLKYSGSFEETFLKLEKADVVIHLATLFKANHKPGDISPLLQSNITLGTHLLEWMVMSNTTNIINFSTYATNTNGHSYSPQNLYSATKQAFSTILTYYIYEKGLSAITLEMYDMYGPNDPRGKFIDLVLRAIKNKEKFKMSPGKQEIYCLHVMDAVSAVLLTIEQVLKNSSGEESFFSVCSKEKATELIELVNTIEQTLDYKLEKDIGFYPYRAKEIMKVSPAHPNLPRWTPKVCLETGIKQKWKEYEN